MVSTGLKSQFLAYGTLTRAQNTIFAKVCFISESHFINKMYPFSVYKMTTYDNEQIFIFVKVFGYDAII